MSNTVLIKEVNNNPVIFNVDNLTDEAALEALHAIKMPEAMAADIFGENIQYADNTTCTITDNPDNAEFPYTVVFDSSKILEIPRRKYTNLAKMGMPSDKIIEYPLSSFNLIDSNSYVKNFVAPANGYMQLAVTYSNSETFAGMAVYSDAAHSKLLYSNGYRNRSINCFLPVFKGAYCYMGFSTPEKFNYARFIYAQGELQ